MWSAIGYTAVVTICLIASATSRHSMRHDPTWRHFRIYAWCTVAWFMTTMGLGYEAWLDGGGWEYAPIFTLACAVFPMVYTTYVLGKRVILRENIERFAQTVKGWGIDPP